MDPLDVQLLVQRELDALRTWLAYELDITDDAAPATLYWKADAAELYQLLKNRAVWIGHTGYGECGQATQAGLGVLADFLERQLSRGARTSEVELAQGVQGKLTPFQAHIECFFQRLYEKTDANQTMLTSRGYAVGLSSDVLATAATTHLDNGLRFVPALYDPDEQTRLLQAAFAGYAHYYEAALARFGREHASVILCSCIDWFLADIGELALRFRPPDRTGEREWLAIPSGGDKWGAGSDVPTHFVIQDNLLCPTLVLPLPPYKKGSRVKMIKHVLFSGALPHEAARRSVSAALAEFHFYLVPVHPAQGA